MKRAQIISDRAKRTLYPVFAVTVVVFVSFLAHIIMLGTSAFPGGGKLVDGRYLVESHGKIFTMTTGQYWFSFIHGVTVVAAFAITGLLVVAFYYTGDLREEDQSTKTLQRHD